MKFETRSTHTTLEVRDITERIIEGRIMAWGETAKVQLLNGDTVWERFAAGSFGDVDPDQVVLRDEHRNTIGRGLTYEDRDDGAYMTFRVANTPAGDVVLALAVEDIIRNLSVGFAPHQHRTVREMGRDILERVSVRLGEVSTTWNPAYAGAAIINVRTQEDTTMSVNDTTEPATLVEDIEARSAVADLEERTVSLERYNTDVEELRTSLAALGGEQTDPRERFDPLSVFEAVLATRYGFAIENRALADVVGDLGTGDASGLSPDFYWAGGLQQRVNRRRPLFASMGSATFPTYGNNLVTGKSTQEIDATSGVAQKAVQTTQTLIVEPVSYPVVWHKTAVDIAIELVEQSNPSALTVAANSMLRSYARAVEVDANAKAFAAATPTGAALDTSSYQNLVDQIVTTGIAIEDATDSFGDLLAVSNADWVLIVGLVDGDGRRMLATQGQVNADGAAPFNALGVDIGGVFVFRSYAVTDALQYSTDTLMAGERSPISVAATNVEKMGYDRGYIGATVIDHWDEGIYRHAAAAKSKK